MDLLRQILARLPLDVILKHYEDVEKVVTPFDTIPDDPEKVFGVRLRVVNRLSEERVERYRKTISSKFVHEKVYPALCAYQGELGNSSVEFVGKSLLFERAVFLRDVQWCRGYSDGGRYTEIALRSDIPEIQARALAVSRYPLNIQFPELINWTKELTSWYHTLLREEIFSLKTGYLTGYLTTPRVPVGNSALRVAYLAGYLRYPQVPIGDSSLRSAYDLGSIKCQGSTELSSEYSVDICIQAGHFPEWIFQCPLVSEYAVKYIQPKLLRRLATTSTSLFAFDFDILVTEDVAQRAREMVTLVKERYPEQTVYRMEMEALGGLHVNMEEFDRLRRTDQVRVIYAMTIVSHPDLPPKFMIGGHAGSTVYYDIQGSFHRDSAIFLNDRVHALYALGKLLDGGRLIDLLNCVTPVYGEETESDEEDIEKRYEKILTHLKSEEKSQSENGLAPPDPSSIAIATDLRP